MLHPTCRCSKFQLQICLGSEVFHPSEIFRDLQDFHAEGFIRHSRHENQQKMKVSPSFENNYVQKANVQWYSVWTQTWSFSCWHLISWCFYDSNGPCQDPVLIIENVLGSSIIVLPAAITPAQLQHLGLAEPVSISTHPELSMNY